MSKKKIFDIEKVGFGDELSYSQRQENTKTQSAKSELQRQQEVNKLRSELASTANGQSHTQTTKTVTNKSATSFNQGKPLPKQQPTTSKAVKRFKPQAYVSPIYGMRQLKITKDVLTDEELLQKEKHKIEQLLKRYEHLSVLDLSTSNGVATTLTSETDLTLSKEETVFTSYVDTSSSEVVFEKINVVPKHILIEQSKALEEDDILSLLELEESVKPHYYELPSLELLQCQTQPAPNLDDWIEEKMRLLENVLAQYQIEAQVVGDFTENQRFVQLDVKLGVDVQVSQLEVLEDVMKTALDVALLSVMSKVDDQSCIKIEISKPHGELIRLRDVLKTSEFMLHESPLYLGIGKDMLGEVIYVDVLSMPHALIAGQNRIENTACLHTILMNILYKASPDEVQLLLIDSTSNTLTVYEEIPHLIKPVITDNSQALEQLNGIVLEMERRYQLFEANGVRDMITFNDRRLEFEMDHPKLPYIVLMIHEIANLMTDSMQETEDYLVHLTQKGQAAGIHLIITTQQVTQHVLTSAIKANMPGRIAFSVAKEEASRTILDYSGAQQLLGEGDMLCLPNRKQQLKHLQLAVVTDEEIKAVTTFVRAQ